MPPYLTDLTIEQLRERYRKPKRKKKSAEREKISKIDGLWPWEHKDTPHREKYRTYMLSPFWLVRKRECTRLAGHICANCQQGKSKMTVHHLHYRNLFNESQDDLICLCWPCHRKVDEHAKAMKVLGKEQTRESVLSFLSNFRRNIRPSEPKQFDAGARAAQLTQEAEDNGWFLALHSRAPIVSK